MVNIMWNRSRLVIQGSRQSWSRIGDFMLRRRVPSVTTWRLFESNKQPSSADDNRERCTQTMLQQRESTTKMDNNEKDDKEEKQLTKTQKLMEQIKEAGIAGIISYGFWEVAFWSASVPVVVIGYHQLTGHWPDLSNKEDVAKLSAQAFVFVNFSRFAIPLRIGLALTTTPWVQRHIVERFMHKKDSTNSE